MMIYDQHTVVWLRENIKIVLSTIRKSFYRACQNENINLPSPCLKGKIIIGCISRRPKICQVQYSYFLDLRSILDIQKLIIFRQNDKYQMQGDMRIKGLMPTMIRHVTLKDNAWAYLIDFNTIFFSLKCVLNIIL